MWFVNFLTLFYTSLLFILGYKKRSEKSLLNSHMYFLLINQIIKISYSQCLLETNARINWNLSIKEFMLKDLEPHHTLVPFASMLGTTLTSKQLSLATSHLSSQLPLLWEKLFSTTGTLSVPVLFALVGILMRGIKSMLWTKLGSKHQAITQSVGLDLFLSLDSWMLTINQIWVKLLQKNS